MMIMCLLLVILYAILTVEGGRCVLMILLQMERAPCSLCVEIHTLKVNICAADWLE